MRSTASGLLPLDEFVGKTLMIADFGAPDAGLRQLRATLAAEIIKALDAEGLSVRDAGARTGVAAADFSCAANRP